MRRLTVFFETRFGSPITETPALCFVREKPATKSMAEAMTTGIALAGTTRRTNAPMIDPRSARPMRTGRRCRGINWPFKKGIVPPKLRKTSVSMLVATATCGLTPTYILTGTVMSDVPPVTTLMKAVKTKTASKRTKLDMVSLELRRIVRFSLPCSSRGAAADYYRVSANR
jgi:hypothetical protein